MSQLSHLFKRHGGSCENKNKSSVIIIVDLCNNYSLFDGNIHPLAHLYVLCNIHPLAHLYVLCNIYPLAHLYVLCNMVNS